MSETMDKHVDKPECEDCSEDSEGALSALLHKLASVSNTFCVIKIVNLHFKYMYVLLVNFLDKKYRKLGLSDNVFSTFRL